MRGAVVVAVTAAGPRSVGAAPAFAHVTAQPGQAPQGGYTVVTFRVPDESDTAGTVKLEVALPTDHPITSVRTTPIPGWTAAVTKTTLNPPVQVNGNAVTEAVGTRHLDGERRHRINPGEFLDFPLSLGPLPTGVDQVALPRRRRPTTTARSSPGTSPSTDGAEPERPAPVVTLTAATGDGAMGGHDAGSAPAPAAAAPAGPTSGSDSTARWLAGGGLLVGALGVGLGAGAVLRSRRSGTS